MTTSGQVDELEIRNGDDVVRARQLVRVKATAAGLSLVDQTKVITATSELARNTHVHGVAGAMQVEVVERGGKVGVRVVFRDSGPGIADVEQALSDGYTTGVGLGLGLGGARRLVDEFDIGSTAGEGTTVTVVKWAR